MTLSALPSPNSLQVYILSVLFDDTNRIFHAYKMCIYIPFLSTHIFHSVRSNDAVSFSPQYYISGSFSCQHVDLPYSF